MNSDPGRRSVTVTARSLADYQSMFALDDADLIAGPILDCPGGASSFGAEVRTRGGQVISVDPAYGTGAAHIAERVQLNLRDAGRILAASTIPIDWGYLDRPRHMSEPARPRPSDSILISFETTIGIWPQPCLICPRTFLVPACPYKPSAIGLRRALQLRRSASRAHGASPGQPG